MGAQEFDRGRAGLQVDAPLWVHHVGVELRVQPHAVAKVKRRENEDGAKHVGRLRTAARGDAPGEPGEERHARQQGRGIAAKERAELRGRIKFHGDFRPDDGLNRPKIDRGQSPEQREGAQPRRAPFLPGAERFRAMAQAEAREDKERRDQRGDERVVHMNDVFHQRQADDPRQRDHAKDQRQRRQRGQRHRQRHAVRADAPQVRQHPQHAEEDEKIEGRIDVPFVRRQLAPEQVIEQRDQQSGRKLVGVGVVIDRETTPERIEKHHP